jgi:hypothetical protein
MSKTVIPAKISAEDLENKLKAFQGDIQGRVDDKKNTLLTVGAGIGVILLILVFVLGKRSGRKKTTFVEIRRV